MLRKHAQLGEQIQRWEKEALSACYDVSRLYLGNDLFYSLPTEIKAHDARPEKSQSGTKSSGASIKDISVPIFRDDHFTNAVGMRLTKPARAVRLADV